jgi:aminoglycoside phosphotransferase (APT) family kinase protein
VVIRETEPGRFGTPEHRRTVGTETVDTLAAIHGVDYESVGLGEFGHPEGFTQRQVKRWSEQFTWAFGTTAQEREVPEIYELMEWLTEHAPADHPHTLVHGDYKLDNLLFAPGTPPELAAVFDWEMATLGDPRTDLGWLLSFWHDPDDPEVVLPDLEPTFTAREGYPSRRELVERWEETTGLEYDHDRFYRTLAVYKLAGLGEMFFARYLQGHADSDFYARMETGVPELARRALRIAEGDEPL